MWDRLLKLKWHIWPYYYDRQDTNQKRKLKSLSHDILAITAHQSEPPRTRNCFSFLLPASPSVEGNDPPPTPADAATIVARFLLGEYHVLSLVG